MSLQPIEQQLEALNRLDTWDGLRRLDAALASLRREPNFFKIAPRVLRVEGVHSDMLAWLLDPQGWHGLADHFARLLVGSVLESCQPGAQKPFAVREVHKEFSTGAGPVDLLLVLDRNGERFSVAIENKIEAPEGVRQIARYADGLTAMFGPKMFALVYLTPDGRTPRVLPDCLFTPLPYATVANHLEAALAASASTTATAGRELARHYLVALRTHIMAQPNLEIDALCRKLYQEHPEAWRAIRRRLPSERDESHAYIAEAVCRRLTADHKGEWAFVVRPDRYACVFRPAWRAFGTSAAKPIVGLEQATDDDTIAKVHFRLVISASESDGDDRFRYTVRLKVGQAVNSDLGKAVVAALRSVPRVERKLRPDREEFTIEIKSIGTLPGPGDEPSAVPDLVVDWFARHLSQLVPALDPVLRLMT